MLNKLKAVLSTNKLTRVPYRLLARFKNYILFYDQRKQLHTGGVGTIEKLQGILEKSGCLFHFDMGTLLGIVREGKLLGHDLDIDMAVHASDEGKINEIRALLLKNGCIHKYRYKIDEIGIVEDSFVINNIKFDINYYSCLDDKSVCYLFYSEPDREYEENKFSVVRLSCSKIDKIVKIPFMGFDINAPQNPKAYLAERYGENWQIPDKNYKYWKGPSAERVDYIGERIEY